MAAAGGNVDGFEASQLVAAGQTLLQRSARLVRALSGKRAAILLPTSPAFITALAASDGRGAVLVHPLAASSEIAWQLKDANVGAVFTTSALVARLPPELPLVLLDDAPRSARVVANGESRAVDLGTHHGLALVGDTATPGRDEECAIVYTSAMTGRARGAILTHRNLLANARATVDAMALTPVDRTLALLPYAHLFGLTVTATAPLLSGGSISTMARFDPAKALELVEEKGITMLVGVPAIFAALVQTIERRGSTFRSHALTMCISGGASLDVQLQDRFTDLTGVELRQGYGLTEAAPVVLANHVGAPNVRGTLGTPMPGVEVMIRSGTTDASLPDGEPGEICVRGDNVFVGYVNGARDGLRLSNGWLHSGDRGCRNPDGTFRFLDVIKPMFTRNGFNIYPRELERVIHELAGVIDAHVYAIPDALRENDIGVQVVGDVTEAAVRAWCDRHLSQYKQPTAVSVVTAVR